MFFIKRFVVWGILLIFCFAQFLLNLTDFSCIVSSNLPICVPQFKFRIIDNSQSIISFEIFRSLREFLKLLSFLRIDMEPISTVPYKDNNSQNNTSLIDMGNELINENKKEILYNEEKLVNTFNKNIEYRVNTFGYCKLREQEKNKNITVKNNKIIEKEYCQQNNKYGMEIFGILIRDIGIQLGKNSVKYKENNKIIGDSLVLMSHLGIGSLNKFFKKDQNNKKIYSKLLFSDKNNTQLLDTINNPKDTNISEPPKNDMYRKGIKLLIFLINLNKGIYWIYLIQFAISSFNLIIILLFGVELFFMGKHHKIFPIIIKLSALVLIVISCVELIEKVIYFTILELFNYKNLEKHINKRGNPMEIIEFSILDGFKIGFARVIVQIVYLIMTILSANYYGDWKTRKIVKMGSNREYNIKDYQ
ncbi:hypothetical protein TBLA_0G02210 [Henningerozyma blattae CBS 6284]|uniref:Uncharacterized protein n=1 Tax=Henningerozyma blattae (strain ATCC 34711 / CBS 6284 / DSM 70876 / NBRC 10599 / NRRL Y-10934 / UCD 77-7) TaxID=1071380 RepID=I2H709_HENB6|nr:hypothetical protein TBLA_0G02210 [Tetrapisispora blattae CBS 6284]CCH62161.1 hypothetical protein TBLA_0G02210 [Tetrapisispora blattae CBS 6284]